MIDTPEGELNIKDFVIEGPKKKSAPQDWEIELTPEDWKEQEKQMRQLSSDNFWSSFVKLAGPTMTLYPDKLEILNLQKDAYENILQHKNWTRYEGVLLTEESIAQVAMTQLLYPDKNVAEDFDISESDILDNIKYLKDRMPNRPATDRVMNRVVEYCILFPQDIEHLKEVEGLFEYLVDRSQNEKSYFGRLSSLAAVKMVAPDHFSPPPPDFHDIIKARVRLDNTSQQGTILENFVRHHLYLKIIASESTKMTDKGLIINMPGIQTLSEPTDPVPEMRKF